MSSLRPSRLATSRRASSHCRVRSLYACRAPPDFSAGTRLHATMNRQSEGTTVSVSRSGRKSIREAHERDAGTPAEGHGEDGEAAVVDVLADQVHAPGGADQAGGRGVDRARGHEAWNLDKKQILRACGAQDDKLARCEIEGRKETTLRAG